MKTDIENLKTEKSEWPQKIYNDCPPVSPKSHHQNSLSNSDTDTKSKNVDFKETFPTALDSMKDWWSPRPSDPIIENQNTTQLSNNVVNTVSDLVEKSIDHLEHHTIFNQSDSINQSPVDQKIDNVEIDSQNATNKESADQSSSIADHLRQSSQDSLQNQDSPLGATGGDSGPTSSEISIPLEKSKTKKNGLKYSIKN